MWGQILSSQGSLISIVSLLCSLVYFIHFNFAAGILRLVYLIFLCLNPLISFIANLVIANNFKNNVLQDQHNLAINAEFLDFEDDDQDILRKAKILAVRRRVALQRYAMTPLFLTGFFKVINERDFPMQMYWGFIIELATVSLPILIIQIINNTLLESWRFEVIFSMVVLALNLLTDLRGILQISDKMTQETNELQKRQMLRRHQR